MKKKVMVTGSSGFIGQHLLDLLLFDYDVIAPSSSDLDVQDIKAFEKYENEKIEHVIHMAGKTFVPQSWESPQQFFNVNTMGTLNVLEFCRKKKISMTYISAYVYGQPKMNPIPESMQVNPNNPYAKSKQMAEEFCKFYCENFESDVSVLRLFNVYGTKQNERFLIPHIVNQVMSEKQEIQVLDLLPKRDYVYITDVCEAIKMSVEKTKSFHLFNIGTGESHSVQEIIDFCQEIAVTNKKVISKNEVRHNELNDVRADIDLIRKEWNWSPKVSIRDGLKKMIGESYE